MVIYMLIVTLIVMPPIAIYLTTLRFIGQFVTVGSHHVSVTSLQATILFSRLTEKYC